LGKPEPKPDKIHSFFLEKAGTFLLMRRGLKDILKRIAELPRRAASGLSLAGRT
jgi:hypothetical protein